MKRVITLFLVVCVFSFCTCPARAQDTNSSEETKRLEQILSDSPEFAYLYGLRTTDRGDAWSQAVAVRIIQLLKENNRLLSEIRDVLKSRSDE